MSPMGGRHGPRWAVRAVLARVDAGISLGLTAPGLGLAVKRQVGTRR